MFYVFTLGLSTTFLLQLCFTIHSPQPLPPLFYDLPAGTTKREQNRSAKDGVIGARCGRTVTHFRCRDCRFAWEGLHGTGRAAAKGSKSYRTCFTEWNRNTTSHPASILSFPSYLPPKWDHPPPQPLPPLSSILFFQSLLSHPPSFPAPHPAPWVDICTLLQWCIVIMLLWCCYDALALKHLKTSFSFALLITSPHFHILPLTSIHTVCIP